jgi:hypothetical protein
MRDEVTRTSNLQGFMCLVQHAWNGEELASISFPFMPNSQRASSYMQNTSSNLVQIK